jgi:hypothetical protein
VFKTEEALNIDCVVFKKGGMTGEACVVFKKGIRRIRRVIRDRDVAVNANIRA